MTEPTRYDFDRAEAIVGGLLAGEPSEAFETEDLVIFDVEADAGRFLADLELLDRFGLPYPAIRLTEDRQDMEDVRVPMSLALLSDSPRLPGWPYPLEYWFLQLERRLSAPQQETMSHEEARGSFFRRAGSFLANRIAAVADVSWAMTFLRLPRRQGGSPIQTPGCNFAVSTNTPNLSVYWSGAYYIAPNYFAHPTTPVGNILQSGVYVFGVDGGPYGNNVQWGTNAVVTLPGAPHVHLNF